MKKCWDCRALEEFHFRGWYCQLKHRVIVEKVSGHWCPRPDGKCPKPRTIKKFLELWNQGRSEGEI